MLNYDFPAQVPVFKDESISTSKNPFKNSPIVIGKVSEPPVSHNSVTDLKIPPGTDLYQYYLDLLGYK